MVIARYSTLLTADAVVLALARPDVDAIGSALTHLPTAVAAEGPDAVLGPLATGALWLCALWIGLALTSVAAGALPGLLGRIGRRTGALVAPVAARRLLAVALGLGVGFAPIAAFAAVPSPTATPRPSVVTTWPTTPDQSATPLTSATPDQRTAPGESASPAPGWPTAAAPAPSDPSNTPPVGLPPITAPPTPAPPITAPPTTAPSATALPTLNQPASASSVVVAVGDSLWSIAAVAQPGASDQQIAAAWPSWYAANAAQVGADPGLILPGQVLQAPMLDPQP
jgi:LysM repeat protein